MKNNLLKRLVSGLLLATLLMAITVATGRAQENPIAVPATTECADCHQEIEASWQSSPHSQATLDPLFVEAWQAQNKASECLACHTTGYDPTTQSYRATGITCDSCHSLVANGPNHPEQIMTTNYSAAACGTCHLDTFAQWQLSQHGQEEMNCINCHNPHSATLKVETVQTLCQTCHTTESHFYNFTAHSQEGLLCTDCHLKVSEGSLGNGHGQREHTFHVDLHTCNSCHEQEMHAPADITTFLEPPAGTSATTTTNSQTMTTIHNQPPSSSYLNLVLLAGIIGLAFGIVGSPWFERGLRYLVIDIR